jgi:mxaJ protein
MLDLIFPLLAALASAPTVQPAPPRPALRVCADPNNLPFSNQRGEGFENKIAALLAHDLGADLTYTWWAQRRGFFRNTLKAKACDVVLGVPARLEMVAATRPYYRASYVFVTRKGQQRAPRSFDDPRLRRWRIGIPIVGDDGENPPPAYALARRGIIDNVVGFSVFGDYTTDSPPLRILEALASGKIDVAIVWGPVAGWFARSRHARFDLAAVSPAREDGVPFVYEIAFGVRRGDDDRMRQLDGALVRNRAAITRILDDYGVPRI